MTTRFLIGNPEMVPTGPENILVQADFDPEEAYIQEITC
jgi:hypothetical protein